MRLTVTKALSAFLVGCALLTGSVGAQARDVELQFKDGRTVRGEFISEDKDTVVVSIASIKTTYNKKDVKNVQTVLTLDEQYAEKKKALKQGDIEGWYALAYWLHTQKAGNKALQEVDALLAAYPKPS